MKKIEISLKFVKHIVNGLVLEGVVIMIVGILIFLYPDLLGMLVGIFLVVTGVMSFVMAAKLGKYSKIKFEI